MPIPEGSISQRLDALETRLAEVKDKTSQDFVVKIRTGDDNKEISVAIKNYSPLKKLWAIFTSFFNSKKSYLTGEDGKEKIIIKLTEEFSQLSKSLDPTKERIPLSDRIKEVGDEGDIKKFFKETKSKLKKLGEQLYDFGCDTNRQVDKAKGSLNEMQHVLSLYKTVEELQVGTQDALSEAADLSKKLQSKQIEIDHRSFASVDDKTELSTKLTQKRAELEDKLVKQFQTENQPIKKDAKLEELVKLTSNCLESLKKINEMNPCSKELRNNLRGIVEKQLTDILKATGRQLESPTLEDLKQIHHLLKAINTSSTEKSPELQTAFQQLKESFNQKLDKQIGPLKQEKTSKDAEISQLSEKVAPVLLGLINLRQLREEESLHSEKDKINSLIELIETGTGSVDPELKSLIDENKAKLSASVDAFKRKYTEVNRTFATMLVSKKDDYGTDIPKGLRNAWNAALSSSCSAKIWSIENMLDDPFISAEDKRTLNEYKSKLEKFKETIYQQSNPNDALDTLIRMERDIEIKDLGTFMKFSDSSKERWGDFYTALNRELSANLGSNYSIESISPESSHSDPFSGLKKFVGKRMDDLMGKLERAETKTEEEIKSVATHNRKAEDYKIPAEFLREGLAASLTKAGIKPDRYLKDINKSIVELEKQIIRLNGKEPGTTNANMLLEKLGIILEREAYEKSLDELTIWSTLENTVNRVATESTLHPLQETRDKITSLTTTKRGIEANLNELESLKIAA